MYRFVLILCLIWPLSLTAQEADEDRGFIVGLLERSLGGEGRVVRIDGFKGLFSSTATIDQISIADDDGVWLTLSEVAINWKRSALLRGRIDVAELRARKIEMPRRPLPQPGTAPSPEATPFALPELPASLILQNLNIESVNLGPPVLGEAATLELSGAATLAGGEGDVKLTARRIDQGRSDQFFIAASYANETRALAIDLDISETADGLLSGLLDIPDRPSVDLEVNGDGLLADFGAQLELRTNGAPRLNGSLALQSEVDGPLAFDVDLGGDVTALFLPEYRRFFGEDVSLRANGSKDTTGALTLDHLALETQALQLRGSLALNAENWPSFIDVEGEIANSDGQPVLFPLTGTPTRVDRVDLKIAFDSAKDDKLSGQLRAVGFDRPDLQAVSLEFEIDGTLRGDVEGIGSVDGRVRLDANDLRFSDANLARAVGPSVRSGFDIAYREGQQLTLRDIAIDAVDWALRGGVAVSGLGAGMETTFDTRVTAGNLSAFAPLAGMELAGSSSVSLKGKADLSGAFDLAIAGDTRDLAIGIPQADAILAGQTTLDISARRDTAGTFLDRLELKNPALNASATATLQSGRSVADYRAQLTDVAVITDALSGPITLDGRAQQDGKAWSVSAVGAGPLDATVNLVAQIDPAQTAVDLTASLPDLEPLVPQLRGGATAQAHATGVDQVWQFDTNISGPFASNIKASGVYDGGQLQASYNASIPDVSVLVSQIPGPLAIEGTVTQLAEGWQINSDASGPFDSAVNLAAIYKNARLAADYTLTLPDVAVVVPQVAGPFEAKGSFAQTNDGWRFLSDLNGPYSSTGSLSAVIADTKLAADYAVSLPNVEPLVSQLDGPLAIRGSAEQSENGWKLQSALDGPYNSIGNLTAVSSNEKIAADYEISLPNVAPLVPQLNGPLAAAGSATQTDSGWLVQSKLNGPYDSTGDVSAILENARLGAEYAFSFPNITSLLPGVNGAVQVRGTAAQRADGYDVNASLEGPSGTQAEVAGLVATDGTLNLGATGQLQLGLANPFLQPRNIDGLAQFNLTASGPPELSSITGEITTSGANLAVPNLPLSFESIDGAVRLDGSQAILDLQARITEGGSITISGPISLDGDHKADVGVIYDAITVRNPALFSTTVSGTTKLRGPLTGGARISGDIEMGETEVLVAPSGVAGVGRIPDIVHVGASGSVLSTIERAGLSEKPDATATPGLPFPLDITVRAPSQIFIRGRGIDAEFGGELQVSGTSSDMISTGQFDLIRGRLDILSKRFNLTEGRVQLQGRFDIEMRIVAETSTDAGSARIIVEGSATSPTVSFEATPEAPEDEVLAQIFFGRDISELSAFQALQLAGAVATLAGGGTGASSRLRESLSLDDLSVDSDEEGNNTVRAGKYITENIYSDIVVGGEDGPEISLRIDLTPHVTLGGKTDAEGNTAIGILIGKDY